MSTKIASLFAEIGADTSKLEAGLQRSKSGLSNLSGAFQNITGISLGFGAAIGAAAGALKFSVDAAIEAEKADANLEATLKSTKGAAGLTADEVKKLTMRLAEMSGQDDEAIQNAEAMLLTFTKIGKDVFPAASEAMVNMAAKFGSLDAASVQLGKALNDPVEGVSALRRVGVMLTDEQEKQIKGFMDVNDIAGAQRVILGELSTEFGGLAEAMGGTTEGSINKLKTSLGNLAETVGGKLAPHLKAAADALNVLLTANEKTTAVLEDHKKEIILTSKSYENYVWELARSSAAQQGNGDGVFAANALLKENKGRLSEVASELKGATEAQWGMIRATNEAKDPTKDYTGFVKSLGFALQDIPGAAQAAADRLKYFTKQAGLLSEGMSLKSMMDSNAKATAEANDKIIDYRQQIKTLEKLKVLSPAEYKKLNELWSDWDNATKSLGKYKDMNDNLRKDTIKELQSKIWTLAGGTYLTDDQKKQLEELKGKLLEAEKAAEALRTEQEKAAKQKIFDMLMEVGKSKGFEGEWFANLLKIGTAFGIIDEKSMNMAKTLNDMDLSKAKFSLQEIYDIISAIMGTPSEKVITVKTFYVESNTGAMTKRTTDKPYAGGGSFIIGPGYQENYPLGGNRFASSGEMVTVTPVGNTQSKKSNQPIIINVLNPDPRSAAREVVRELQRRQ